MTKEQIEEGNRLVANIHNLNNDIISLDIISKGNLRGINFYLEGDINKLIYANNISIFCIDNIIDLIRNDINNSIKKLETQLEEL